MAASGTIGSKIRTRSGYNNGVLQFAIELLIKARSQVMIPHGINFSSSTLDLSINGEYFVGSTTVTMVNCKKYKLNSSLPAGSAIYGHTGNNGDVLTFYIPISAVTSGVSYGISADGLDDRTRSNIFVHAPTSSSIQPVITVTGAAMGDNYLTNVASKNMTLKTPPMPDLTITSVWPSSAASSSVPTIQYQTHVESIGWQEWKSNGAVSGTSGRKDDSVVYSITNVDISGTDEYVTISGTFEMNMPWGIAQGIVWKTPVSASSRLMFISRAE